MADLDVQPKKKSPIWPWILILLVIAAVIFFLTRDSENDMDTGPAGTDTSQVYTQPDADTVNQLGADTTMRTDTITP